MIAYRIDLVMTHDHFNDICIKFHAINYFGFFFLLSQNKQFQMRQLIWRSCFLCSMCMCVSVGAPTTKNEKREK